MPASQSVQGVVSFWVLKLPTMSILGLHHVTAVTAQAQQNLDFYTRILGLRLVKKTVNQDDVSAYHLFYADKIGTPGTDITFFDWPSAGPKELSTDAITTTMFRVNSSKSLEYWLKRLQDQKVDTRSIEPYGQTNALRFVDPEGQDIVLVNDQQSDTQFVTWERSEIPAEHQLKGFMAVRLSVPSLAMVSPVLERLLQWEKQHEFSDLLSPNKTVHVFGMDGGGPGKEIHVVEEPGMPGWTTAGSVHHAAFRVKNREDLEQWQERMDNVGLGNSGIVDRFYFQSLYFRITPGILFELATDGPGFDADEPSETLGERLSLPPFLEPRRAEIEAGLKPLEL